MKVKLACQLHDEWLDATDCKVVRVNAEGELVGEGNLWTIDLSEAECPRWSDDCHTTWTIQYVGE